MQRTSAALRFPSPGFAAARLAQVVVVAIIALVLVVAGCTVAQFSASASSLSPAAVSQSAPQTAPQTAVLNEVTAAQRLLACIPGKDKTRAETNALSPASAALLHDPAGTWVQTAVLFGAEGNPSQRAGRIPAALTHLDLGILRT